MSDSLKDTELKVLQSQLQEAKQQETTVQVQLKLRLAVERMKRSQEQCTAQQNHSEKIHGSESKDPTNPRRSLPTI
jgi:hypothetical protein